MKKRHTASASIECGVPTVRHRLDNTTRKMGLVLAALGSLLCMAVPGCGRVEEPSEYAGKRPTASSTKGRGASKTRSGKAGGAAEDRPALSENKGASEPSADYGLEAAPPEDTPSNNTVGGEVDTENQAGATPPGEDTAAPKGVPEPAPEAVAKKSEAEIAKEKELAELAATMAIRKKLMRKLPEGMVLVEPGTYTVGCQEGDNNCYDDEKPPFTVEIGGYGLMKHEVTAAEYDLCEKKSACPKAKRAWRCNSRKSGKEGHPINCVDWTGATAYCAFRGWRLPSEQEWEIAARGVDGPDFPWGDDRPNCGRTVMAENGKGGCGTKGTKPVGSAGGDRSWVAALDMGGSVREWVATSYSAYAGGTVDTETTGFVNRGASWQMDADSFSTSHTRQVDAVGEKRPDLGFRCAVSLN